MSISTHSRGLKKELEYSRSFHRHSFAVLIDASWLRRMQCGQVDLVGLDKRTRQGEIVEVKSHPFVTAAQRYRLRKTQTLLARIFQRPFRLKFALGEA